MVQLFLLMEVFLGDDAYAFKSQLPSILVPTEAVIFCIKRNIFPSYVNACTCGRCQQLQAVLLQLQMSHAYS